TVKTAVLQGKRGRNRPVDPSSTEPPRARARGGGVELLGQLGKIGPKSPANAGFLQLTQAWVNWELLWGAPTPAPRLSLACPLPRAPRQSDVDGRAGSGRVHACWTPVVR